MTNKNKSWEEQVNLQENGDLETEYYGRDIKEALGFAEEDKNSIDEKNREIKSIEFVKKHKAGTVEWTHESVKSYRVVYEIANHLGGK